ncbi:MAG TPA: DUF2529 domain-containing protein [Aliicoccus persicus]|uniref:DUF2529 domain-containing protein n=1 Tax=Aliicoccus persicus TaxID=930138 RepID=A0A921B603_9STAP|nr:DUF2529 domain-containing protein [Aliicoccus persicus]
MDKILQTQFTHILNGLHDQTEEIEMAARLLAQASFGEGNVYIRGFGDFELLEDFLTESETALPGALKFGGIAPITSADRVLVLSKYADEPLSVFLEELEVENIEYVLVCNKKGGRAGGGIAGGAGSAGAGAGAGGSGASGAGGIAGTGGEGSAGESPVDFESVHHFIDLKSPREVVPTPDLDRIVNPYIMSFMYLYYQMYALIQEMNSDE